MRIIAIFKSRTLFALFVALLVTGVIQGTVRGDYIFVTNAGNQTIGEYTTSGATVTASLVPALSGPQEGIAVSGSNLFVLSDGTGTIGEYTTSGATVNASLVSGLEEAPFGIAVSTVPEPSMLGLSCFMAIFGLKRRSRR